VPKHLDRKMMISRGRNDDREEVRR
jgi:hypothetical protein